MGPADPVDPIIAGIIMVAMTLVVMAECAVVVGLLRLLWRDRRR